MAGEAAVDKVPPNSGFSLCGISRSETGLMSCDAMKILSLQSGFGSNSKVMILVAGDNDDASFLRF